MLEIGAIKEGFKVKTAGFNNPKTGEELYSSPIKEPEYLIDNFLARGNLTNLTGPPGGGKTILSLYMIANITCKKILDRNCDKPFRTLFIDEENGEDNTAIMWKKIIDGVVMSDSDKECVNKNVVFHCVEGFRLNQSWANILRTYLNSLEKKGELPDLIVIDNLARIFEGDGNTSLDARSVHNILKPISLEYNIAILLLSHTRKGNPTNLQDISGSVEFGAQVTIAYITKKVYSEEGSVTFWFRKVKNNLGSPEGRAETIVLKEVSKYAINISHKGFSKEAMKKVNEQIEEEILAILPKKWTDIVKTLSTFNEGTVKTKLSQMKKEGKIKKEGEVWVSVF